MFRNDFSTRLRNIVTFREINNYKVILGLTTFGLTSFYVVLGVSRGSSFHVLHLKRT